MRRGPYLLLLTLLFWFVPLYLSGAVPEPPEGPGITIQEAEKRANELSVRLVELRKHQAPGVEKLARRLNLLRELQSQLQRQVSAANRLASLGQEAALASSSAKDWSPDQELPPPPYQLPLFDLQKDQLEAAQQKLATLNLSLSLAKKAKEESGKRLKEAERRLRSLQDQKPNNPGDLEDAELERHLSLVEQKVEDLVLTGLEEELNLTQSKITRVETLISLILKDLIYAQEPLDEQLARLKERRSVLELRIALLLKEQKDIEASWLEANQSLEMGRSEIYRQRADALLKSRQAWRETYQEVLEQTEVQLSWITKEQRLWQRRYRLLQEKTPEDLNLWQNETNGAILDLERLVHVQQTTQTHLQALLLPAEQEADLANSEWVKKELNNRSGAIRKRIERGMEYLAELQRVKGLFGRLSDELRQRAKSLAFKEKLGAAGQKIKDGWEVELWVIDDQPVTLKKITLSLVLLVLGLIASRRLTHLLRKKLLSQTHLDESARDATEKGVWYLLVLLVSLASLTIVNIPLTAFTFLGGALAIGVGFGAQNLMNNFISGFIMMFERPIKIGDLIEIDGNFGVIEEIGARCTRVRTLANVHILVPNSTFLEKNITNWTLSSHEVRCGVDIGVAYGTPSRKVEEVLLRVAMKTDRVQAEPKPLVLFQDFGDSSLAFSLYVSIAVKDLIDRRQIESNLRHAIDQAFKEAGLVIAFPQLDVHLIDPRST